MSAWGSRTADDRDGSDGGLSVVSTMMLVMLASWVMHVDPADPIPLHEQVAAEIRRAIADGECGPGERMPPAKDLAAVLGVNANTALRALRILRDEGLLEFRRGRGITVTGSGAERSAVVSRARELVQFARQQGYRREEVVRIIEGLPLG